MMIDDEVSEIFVFTCNELGRRLFLVTTRDGVDESNRMMEYIRPEFNR